MGVGPEPDSIEILKAEDIYWLDGSYVEDDTCYTKISYVGGNHSAVRSDEPGWFISKWGEGPLVKHLPGDCSYAATTLYYSYYESADEADGKDYSYAYGDYGPEGTCSVRLSQGSQPGTAWYWINIGTTCVLDGMQVGVYSCDWAWFGDGPSVYIQNKNTYEYS
jgi:hypothetical protein